MPTLTDQAICIRQWDWSETSQTVSIFARTLGIVRAVAKGSKRERSRFSGGLEPLTRAESIVILKPGAELATMTSWDLQEVFPSLRRSLSSFYSGIYLADLVQHSLTERDPHPALFDALLRSLRLLGEPPTDRLAVLLFQWATLVETGYRPELDADILTNKPLADAPTYIFLPAMGGFTADPLPGEHGAAVPQGPSWRMRAGTLSLLRLAGSDASGEELLAAAAGEAGERAPRLLAFYLREILGRDMTSIGPLFGERSP
jgi:DNA repair protein RecO (recombination protein O)